MIYIIHIYKKELFNFPLTCAINEQIFIKQDIWLICQRLSTEGILVSFEKVEEEQ